MKRGKEFIFPENIDRDYGIWKDYALKDFSYTALTGGLGLLFIVLPPYNLILVLTRIVVVTLAMTIVMAILTIKPVNARENIKVRDCLKIRGQYAENQKLYFLKPQKRDGMESELEEVATKQERRSVRVGLLATKD